MFLCNEPITLIRPIHTQTTTTYRSFSIPRAGWHGCRSLKLTDNGAVSEFSVSVRIPADVMPADLLPRIGDYLFRGTLTDTDPAALPDLIRSDSCFRIRAVHDNRRAADTVDFPSLSILFPHWRLLA